MAEFVELAEVAELPTPPRLHWGWVLLLTILTGGIFAAFWMLTISRWLQRIRGVSQANGWAWVFMVAACVNFVFDLPFLPSNYSGTVGFLDGATFVLYVVVAFMLQGELEEPPIGLRLSGAMVFFFAPIYFQYHLHQFGDRYANSEGKVLFRSSR